jgi:hypothetical protein
MPAPVVEPADTHASLLAPTPAPPFRLVLARDKQARLAQRVGTTPEHLACPVAGCGALGLAVVLVEDESTAVLCPRHELVTSHGERLEGQPMFVTAAW